jgi:hypothetical protein
VVYPVATSDVSLQTILMLLCVQQHRLQEFLKIGLLLVELFLVVGKREGLVQRQKPFQLLLTQYLNEESACSFEVSDCRVHG